MVSEWSATQEEYEKYPHTIVKLECVTCRNVFYRRAWAQRQFEKHSKGRGPFCTPRCSLIGRNKSAEQKAIISMKQKGVSVLSRGRVGHTVPMEIREKIRLSKTGKPSQTDWGVVVKEVEYRGIKNGAIMTAPIPDYVFVDEHGKLAAIEVEKEKWEAGIRKKMQEYKDHPNKWDKVILVWYLPDGTRMKEWTLQNNEWREM